MENIVCICPTCHRAIHFGDEPTRTEILKKLFTPKRAEALKKVGIPITTKTVLQRLLRNNFLSVVDGKNFYSFPNILSI